MFNSIKLFPSSVFLPSFASLLSSFPPFLLPSFPSFLSIRCLIGINSGLRDYRGDEPGWKGLDIHSQNLFHSPLSLVCGLYEGIYVAMDNLELLILQSFTSLCWDYRGGPPHPIYIVLQIEFRALCLLGKHCTKLHCQS